MTFTHAAIPLFLMAAHPLVAQPTPAIENDQVRILVVTDEPHRPSALHGHSMNRVLIYLDAGAEKLTYEGGRVVDLKFQAGEVRWSPAGGRHTAENTGNKPCRVVEMELKNQGRSVQPPALDPVRLAPKIYKVLIDNPQVRVLRVHIPPKQKVPLHEHVLNRAVVYLTDQHARVTEEGGKANEVTAMAGEIRWAGKARHSEENIGAKPIEVIVVELK